MVTYSAAVLQYAVTSKKTIMVFIAHMGGPFWSRKDNGGWSLPKGEFVPAEETAVVAAAREFQEEIGVGVDLGSLIAFGEFRQPSGKVISVFLNECDAPNTKFIQSNEFEMEWPRGSGNIRSFPEIDRADWFSLATAREKLLKGQRPILDKLLTHAQERHGEVNEGELSSKGFSEPSQSSLF